MKSSNLLIISSLVATLILANCVTSNVNPEEEAKLKLLLGLDKLPEKYEVIYPRDDQVTKETYEEGELKPRI